MKNQITEQELQSRLDALPREIAPENDVWSAISSRIGGQHANIAVPGSKNRWWIAAAAASVALAISAGVFLERGWNLAPGTENPGFSSTAPDHMIRSGALTGVLAASELVDQEGEPPAPAILDQMADQAGLAGAKEAGDDGRGNPCGHERSVPLFVLHDERQPGGDE